MWEADIGPRSFPGGEKLWLLIVIDFLTASKSTIRPSALTAQRKLSGAKLALGSWGTILKPAAFTGRLCFGYSVGQGVRFTRPDTWLAAAPQPVDPQAALAAAARRFLAAYGPATYHDLARWWVDQAVRLAAVQGRKIEAADLRQALSEMGGKDRPLIQSVQWEDLVVEEDVERDLRTLGALA